MKKLFALIFGINLIFCNAFTFCQEEPSKAFDIKTFALDPDEIGALANSINLFSGQVDLPLNLISMKGRNGLDVNVSISYSSNVKNIVDTWNLEAPTGVLGLGWQFGYSQIVVDHKQTGTMEDDEFYLMENGTSNKLICIEINPGNRKYKCKTYQFWDITYYNNDSVERWEIIKEDGIKYVYGGDLGSERNTVQYSSKWENWIGNSKQTSGVSSIVVSWNLSQVRNLWGEEITFSYEIAEVILGASKQTEASYLKKITDNFNRQIDFYYADKISDAIAETYEYQEPHTEVTTEPDAYQERYERKYLDSIVVKNADSFRLFSIHFGYETHIGSGTLYKRQLTSITQKNSNWELLPNLKFTYNSSSETNQGALKEIILPTGGIVTYFYGEHEIEYSELSETVDAPPGYAEPRVFIHNNYVVITWRYVPAGEHTDNDQPVMVDVYEWDGKWNRVLRQSIGSVKAINNLSDYAYQDFSISLQDDFFAILTASVSESWITRQCRLYIFTKNPLKKGVWIANPLITLSESAISGEVVSGKDFVAVRFSEVFGSEVSDYLTVVNKDYLTWSILPNYNKKYLGKFAFPIGNFVDKFIITAQNNYLLLFRSDTDPDAVHISYFTETGELTEINDQGLDGINVDGGWGTHLYTNGFSLLLFGEETQEFIFDWNETFHQLTNQETIGGYPNSSLVFSLPGGYGITKGDYYDRSIICRRNGIDWYQSSEGLHKGNSVSFGEDFYLWTHTNDDDVTLRQFNPINSTWFDSPYSLNEHHVKKTGFNLFSLNEKIYNREPNGNWALNSSTLFVPPGEINNVTIRHGNKFSVYESNTGSTINTYFVPQKNKQILNYTEFIGRKIWHYVSSSELFPVDKSELVGYSSFVTYSASFSSDNFRDVTSFNLYKVINNKANGKLNEYFVKGFTINDGYKTNTTAVHYYPEKCVQDPGGSVVQYNKVRVIPGGSITNYNRDDHPYGYTDTYFFNGLSRSEVSLAFPSNIPDVTNAEDYYKFLSGNIYETRVYDNNNILKSSMINYWYIYSKDISNTKSFYARLLRKDEMLDNVTKTTEYVYSETSGLVKSQEVQNYNSNGIEETLKTEYLYGYESSAYSDDLLPLNLLTPLIQIKIFNGESVTGMNATTLLNWGNSNVWAPHKSYIRTTEGTSGFNFNLWSGTGEPVDKWLKTSEIILIDDKGQVVQSKDVDGIYSTIHYDKNGLQVGVFKNTFGALAISDNFDDLSFTDGEPNNWAGNTDWVINDLGALHYTSNTSSAGIYPTLPLLPPNPTGFIAEFDIRVPKNSSLTDWGGFVFRKNTPYDNWLTSGYTILLRKNGTLELVRGILSLGSYQLTETTLNWQRVRIFMAGSEIKVYLNGILRISVIDGTFTGNNMEFYAFKCKADIDNILIYPDYAYASMTSYDPTFLLPLKNIDTKGKIVKNVYDSFQRRIGVVGPTNIPISTSNTFLSLDRYSTFNIADPNSSFYTTVNGNFGLYNDFSTHISNWNEVASNETGHSVSTWEVDNGKLKHTDSGITGESDYSANLLYFSLDEEISGRIGIEFSVKIDEFNLAEGFGIGIGDNLWDLDANNAPFFGSATWAYFRGNNLFKAQNNGGTVDLAEWLNPGQYHRVQIVLDVTTKKADFFVDGKACLSDFPFVKSTTANIKKITFFNYGRNGGIPTTWYIDDFMVYTEPSHSMVFTDGTGKTLQTQSEESSSSIICSEILYDALGRGYVQTMPVRITTNWLGFVPDFVTSFNDGTGVIAGTVLTGSVDGYPYSRTVFESSPLGRSIEQGQPGNELRIGNGHTIRNMYSSNTSGQFPISYPGGKGFVTTSINADGVYGYELKDKLGRTLATKSGPVLGNGTQPGQKVVDENSPTNSFYCTVSGTAHYDFEDNDDGTASFSIGTSPGWGNIVQTSSTEAGDFQITYGTSYYLSIQLDDPTNIPQPNLDNDAPEVASAIVNYSDWAANIDINPVSTNEYDIYGNIIKIYQPNYYNLPDPSFDKNGYTITMTYDFNRLLKTKSSSDFGTTKYIYDKAGRLRFSMDANGENQTMDNIKYIKYDNLGRVIEEGYKAFNWSENTLQNKADTDPSWPTNPATWRKKYIYGLHGTDIFQRGELTQVLVNNDDNTSEEVTETYTYNVLGDVTTVSTTTGGINQAISYTYNYDGQVATVNYGTTTVYYAYDRLGRVSTIGTSSDVDYYASYSYENYNGSMYLEKLNNNSIRRAFSYNNHGWLSKINDENFFEESIIYHTDGYGGAGYYNGNISKISILDKVEHGYFDYNVQFKYDNLGRILAADHTNSYNSYENYDLGVGTGNEIKFDANGNLSFVREGTTNRNYKYFSSTNLLKNKDGSTNTSYTHDMNGNIGYSFPRAFGLSYDPYFNLTMSVGSTTYTTSFYYGADNERVYKQHSINGNPTIYKTYYFRGLSDYPLVEKNYENTTLVNTTLYIYGPTGLISVQEGSTTSYILKDHLGSTRMVLNSNSSIDSRYNYAPFGSVMYSTITTDVAYKFTGQEYDDEFGLHNFRARLYDDELGMFYAYDPSAQGFSPFGYAGNNPVIYIDKDGKIFGIDDLVFVGILAIGGVINTAMHWNDINKTEGGFWSKLGKGLEFFSVGAISAGAAVIPGGGFIAVGGSSLLNLSGNSLITGDAITLKDVGVTLVTAGLFYGFGNIARGGSFFDDWMPTFSSKTPAEQLAEKTAKSLAKDELPSGLGEKNLLTSDGTPVPYESFEGNIHRIVLKNDVNAYRYWGGISDEYGRWLTTKQTVNLIGSPLDAIKILNLPKGTSAEYFSKFIIPRGSEIFMGRVAGGSGTQIWFNNYLYLTK